MPGVQQSKVLVFHRTMEFQANRVLSAYFSSHRCRKINTGPHWCLLRLNVNFSLLVLLQ